MRNIILKGDTNIFLNILNIIILIIFVLAVGLIVLVKNSGLEIYLILLGILIISFVVVIIYLLGLVFLIIRLMKTDSIPKFLVSFFERSIKIIYPIMIMLSNTLKIQKDPIRRFLSEINNKIVVLKNYKLKPEEILIVAPHCLQKSLCKHKITGDINNCKRCGACDIHMLLELCERYKISLEVVPGGTLARKVIKDHRPKGVIAVACERDLSYGILDVKYIPVIGVIIQRPEGPCRNTCLDVPRVEEAIKHYLGIN